MIIALDVEQHLLDTGVKKVSIASNVTQALEILANEKIDAALLDVNLGVQVSTPVAEELLKRRTPFAFASGYGEALDLGEEFRHIERIQKPFNTGRLNDLIKIFGGAKL